MGWIAGRRHHLGRRRGCTEGRVGWSGSVERSGPLGCGFAALELGLLLAKRGGRFMLIG